MCYTVVLVLRSLIEQWGYFVGMMAEKPSARASVYMVGALQKHGSPINILNLLL